jgi:branched-chain amino acid transport system permease protein
MTAFIQYVITGLAVGSIYAIVALGFSLVFKATGVFNFAQGALMMLGAFLAWTATARWGLPLIPAIILTLVISAALGVAMHFVVIRPLMGSTLLTLVMATIALSLIITSMASIIWGSQQRLFPSPIPDHVLHLGQIRISTLDLIVIGVSFACMVAFALFFRFTTLGLHMRATAENSEAAVLSGVNSQRVFVVTFAVALMLASVGGILLANIQLVSLSLGDIGLLAFPAVVVGGLTSIQGAVVGGLLIGVIEQLSAAYISIESQDVIVYVVLLLVLLVRPSGLLGEREVVRV